MLKWFHNLPIRFPAVTLAIVAGLTVAALSQFGGLKWETDARVYFPKDHPAIKYDAYVADVFGARDAIIIAIVNDKGIFNKETLERVERITSKIAKLPGVQAHRELDVDSLATATIFSGTDDAINNVPLMPSVPADAVAMEALKNRIYSHPDLFVGNLVSPDGKATMIRAKIKEGIANRYQSYFQIKGILSGELAQGSGGAGGAWPGNKWGNANGGGDWKGNQWTQGKNASDAKSDADGDKKADKADKSDKDGKGWSSGGGQQWWGDSPISDRPAGNGDFFYMAGRPVIEVTSGQYALKDTKLMIPLLTVTVVVVLFFLFRNLRGVMLPLFVVAISITWTMGLMAALGVPLYTISTMLPVILVAVGIGDALHILSHYEDIVIDGKYKDNRVIVAQLMTKLSVPLLVTTLTTGAGFLSLWWAEMPPFRIFGVFTALGILFCWLVSVLLMPAALTLLKPHVSSYLQRKRSMRVHSEAGLITRALTGLARALMERRAISAVVITLVTVFLGFGGSRLYVDSSWISDFKKGSEVERSNTVLNEKFNGTVFLNVILDSQQEGGLKSPVILKKIERMQDFMESKQDVGGSLSIVDYLKSTNKTFHADDPKYDVLPDSAEEVGAYFYLLSLSGRPELLNSVIDYNDQRANITIDIRTDHTQRLMALIDDVRAFAKKEFAGTGVTVNFAGSANNAYIWADLLIKSQIMAIMLSKIGIFLVAMLLFRSPVAALFTVLPVALTTIWVAGGAGWLGIPLDVSTVLAAGVAIGVGVDYAVHFVYRYAYDRERKADADKATLSAVRGVGKPIIFNAAVVTAGFLILGLSQFPPNIKLGYFVAAYMVASCAAALLVLPLTLATFKPHFRAMGRFQGKEAGSAS
ncbi:MAG: MMPL family transporter [Gammaproteobacteria bacterium]|nr:MMPL family transporter [Gammaproteobacteria bacterium]